MLVFNLSEDIPNLTNHDISESNMIRDICIRELCHHMPKKLDIEKLHFLVRSLNKVAKKPREEIFKVCKKIIHKLEISHREEIFGVYKKIIT